MRYKHFYQMPDEELKSYSMYKAYNSVQKSGKMQLKEAMPAITTLAIGTSLAIAQPGKLSAKAKTGLGFLVLSSVIGTAFGLVSKGIDKYYKNTTKNNGSNENKKSLIKLGALVATASAVFGAASVISKKGIFPESSKIGNFITAEKATLVKELNNSRVGKFVENTLNPVLNNHPKIAGAIGNVLPFGLIAGSAIVNNHIDNSISKDMARLSEENYIKGRSAQIDAKSHFDSIDAIEV